MKKEILLTVASKRWEGLFSVSLTEREFSGEKLISRIQDIIISMRERGNLSNNSGDDFVIAVRKINGEEIPLTVAQFTIKKVTSPKKGGTRVMC
ncbi:MAG: hypothetical protein WC246_02470 [Candidatus Paceibacterota bacterium]